MWEEWVGLNVGGMGGAEWVGLNVGGMGGA